MRIRVALTAFAKGRLAMFQNQLKKFRDFAIKGNVVDMAIGIVIGASFGKIATSLVNDIIMPPIGLLLGRVDFNSLFVSLDGKTYASLDAAKKAGAATFNYGAFVNNVLDFLIVAFAMFIIVQWYQSMAERFETPVPVEPPKVKDCPYCLSSIPMAASRCPHCTSRLDQPQAA
jgi:large conductance mechanosensitive channel